MGGNEEFKEMIYESKNIVIKAIIFIGIVILVGMLTIGNDIKLLVLIFNLIIIMGSFTIIFLIISILKVYDQKNFKALIISYSMYIIIAVIYYFDIYESKRIFDISRYLSSMAYSNFIIVLIIDIKIKVSVNYKINSLDIKKNCLLLIIGGILYKLPGEYVGGICLILLTVFRCLKYLYSLREYEFINKDKINYFKINTYLFITMEGLMLLNYFNGPYSILLILAIYLLIIIFCLSFICIINKVVNNPYKSLFKNLYEETAELSKINKKLNDKNQELERNQIGVKRKEKMFKLFFNNAPVAILMANTVNRRVVYCNKNFLDILNKKNVKDVINKKFESIITIKENDYKLERDVLYSGEVEKDGEKRSIEIRVIDINIENEVAILLAYDSTQKRKIEQTKEKIKKELLEEEIKREFLSNITHDLKTPVNVIYSATQLEKILIENQNIEEISKYNFLSKQNCKSLISLTNNLIDSSKMNTNYMKPRLNKLNIVDIIEDTVQSLAEYAKINKIDLIFDTNDEEVICNIDEEFLTRIITNLVSNSIKFTDDSGEIRVGVENLFDGWVKIEVVDNGVGMDDYFLKIAFERYSMDREDGSKVTGTGIGLFVVKKFVDLLGGQIKIDSVVGIGTKIEIFFKVER